MIMLFRNWASQVRFFGRCLGRTKMELEPEIKQIKTWRFVCYSTYIFKRTFTIDKIKETLIIQDLNPAFNDYLPLKGKLSHPRVA